MVLVTVVVAVAEAIIIAVIAAVVIAVVAAVVVVVVIHAIAAVVARSVAGVDPLSRIPDRSDVVARLPNISIAGVSTHFHAGNNRGGTDANGDADLSLSRSGGCT